MTMRLGRALALILIAAGAQAADWREFRGPDGTGLDPGKPLPTKWGPQTNVTWRADVPGSGWSSPILVGDKLILTTAVPDAASPKRYALKALAFDAGTGKPLWERELFTEDVAKTPQPHKKNSHASPTPVSDGKRVWVHFGHMGTACLSLAGEVVWKTQELTYEPVHGGGASPILVDDLIVFPCDGRLDPFLAALDAGTGKVRWKTPRQSGARMAFSFATCLTITHEGRRMIVSPASDFCMGYDPKTGQELWRVKSPSAGWSLISQPVYADGLVFICTGYPSQQLLAFAPTGSGDITASVVWQTKRNVPNTPTPIAVGGELYGVSDAGFLTCYDAKTGQVHYAERLAGKAYSASPIVNDGKLFVVSEDGVGQVIPLGKTFAELARNDLKEKTFATFVPGDGSLFVRTESKLYRFDAK